MNYGMASANRVTWSASRGAYSQRRLMLWAADTAGATVEGRRFMPPGGSGGGTQPGGGGAPPPRGGGGPPAREGGSGPPGGGGGPPPAPAAESSSSAHSARSRLVLCTSDSRPTITPPIVAQDAPLSGGLRRRVPA